MYFGDGFAVDEVVPSSLCVGQDVFSWQKAPLGVPWLGSAAEERQGSLGQVPSPSCPPSVPQLCHGAGLSQDEGFPSQLACCFWGWQSTLLQPWDLPWAPSHPPQAWLFQAKENVVVALPVVRDRGPEDAPFFLQLHLSPPSTKCHLHHWL